MLLESESHRSIPLDQIFSTTTLAWDVNSPASTVIITQIYNPEQVRWLIQMLRPAESIPFIHFYSDSPITL